MTSTVTDLNPAEMGWTEAQSEGRAVNKYENFCLETFIKLVERVKSAKIILAASKNLFEVFFFLTCDIIQMCCSTAKSNEKPVNE